jgi:spore germination protein GerM
MRRWFSLANLAGLLLFALGLWAYIQGSQGFLDLLPEAPLAQTPSAGPLVLKLFFGTQEGGLEAENRQLADPGTYPLQLAVEQWVAGPQNEGLLPLVPQELPAPQVYLHSGTAYLNLPLAYSRLSLGSTGESQLLGALSRTLLEFAEVQQVQFLLDGKPAASLGHLSLEQPFTRN